MNKVDLKVNIGELVLKNPIILASGTAGYGYELKDYIDYNEIGAFIAKGIHFKEKMGNPSPRIYETPCGMINSIGLQGIGVKKFKEKVIPFWEKYNTVFGVNVSGDDDEEFSRVVEYLNKEKRIDFFEINLSCPNLKEGGITPSHSPEKTFKIVKMVRETTSKPLWVKLSPQVTSIEEIAYEAISAGADALTIANTYIATAIDINKRKPVFSNIFGGLSGPAIKPITLALLLKIKRKFDVPVVASGGVFSGEDALEYIIVGANAVEIGTATIVYPSSYKRIINEIIKFLNESEENSLKNIIGSIKT